MVAMFVVCLVLVYHPNIILFLPKGTYGVGDFGSCLFPDSCYDVNDEDLILNIWEDGRHGNR